MQDCSRGVAVLLALLERVEQFGCTLSLPRRKRLRSQIRLQVYI